MRRTLLLTLTLVLGLVIFSGCEMANNPMEVETGQNGSIEMRTNSTVETVVLSIEIINENSNGNLVFRFSHENSSLLVNSIKINETELEIVNYNCVEPRSITQIVVDTQEVVATSTMTMKIDMNMENLGIVIDRHTDSQVWNQPIKKFITKTIDDFGNETYSVASDAPDTGPIQSWSLEIEKR